MKTIEEIKKFFPNHKFEDDFDLKLIQFTAEDLIDFSEEYVKKVAIASLEKVKELKPEVKRFVEAQKRKDTRTVEQMYLENLRKEKRKNKSCTKKPPHSWR